MTPEEEDRNAGIIRLADGTVVGLENPMSVGYKDAPKIVVDPKRVKVKQFTIPVGKFDENNRDTKNDPFKGTSIEGKD
mgnify:FL=1